MRKAILLFSAIIAFALSAWAENTEDGTITWREGFLENYYKKRFENPTCLKCKYLPICMGRCPRNYDKNDVFYCKLRNTNIEIENSIVNYIDYMYEKNV